MKGVGIDAAIGRRLAVARYARGHSKAETARHFGCCWRTVQAALQRIEEYERMGDISALQNRARGKAGRTAAAVEAQVMTIYQESASPERPQGRRYSAAKVARLLAERHGIVLSRKTAWLILHRGGAWEKPRGQKRAIPRFERAYANALWQIDLIEDEPTKLGPVYGVPILDDHSRYLVGLRFFLSKEAESVLLTTYLAMKEQGTPAEILCDRGGQFVDPTGQSTTCFQDLLQTLGITLTIAPRAQTKGKEERLNQFIERDFLDEVRWQVSSLAELNALGESWRRRYNQEHVNETTQQTPQERYRKGVQVDAGLLKQLFAREERRKVSREGTVSYFGRSFRVPDEYIGTSVWVANYFNQHVEVQSGDKVIASFDL
jgi:transposase